MLFWKKKAAGCHYFWDGDVIPQADSIPLDGWDIHEAPRFEYRAIRYFAHRGLHRFQAEHWSLEDWQKEIDWLLKRRLNLFMLRIGTDDLFQRAFPDIVPYPSNEKPLPESLDGYNNRTTFWSLEFQGKMREALLAYAFQRDLFHPEDCGTMTHWYSRTPLAFLEKVKPTLMQQESTTYSEKTGLAWDIFDEKNLKNYQHLTKTHIKEYGRPDIFHTIGLAERSLRSDREKGLAIKKHAYDTVTDFVKEHYPDSPLLIAAWDFFFCYQPEEVRKMVKSLDPGRHIILDYTVDLKKAHNDFEQWDVVGKFPWIFGIFHGYQPQSHIHGDYGYLDKKLKIADTDPFCKGMAFWPELSHSDSFMLEYFTDNAWRPDFLPLEERIDRFCEKRYGKNAKAMQAVWRDFLPLYSLTAEQGSYTSSFFDLLEDRKIARQIPDQSHPKHEKAVLTWRERIDAGKKCFNAMVQTVSRLAALPEELLTNAFIARDAVDLLRSIVERKLDLDFLEGALAWLDGADANEVREIWNGCIRLLELFAQLLATREEFSVYHTVEGLKRTSRVNPHFPDAVKDNLINWYCRSSVYEAVRYVYLPEMKVFCKTILEHPRDTYPDFTEDKKCIFDQFLARKLCDMKPEKQSFASVCKAILTYFTR